VTTGDAVTLNGLLLDGANTGSLGIYITHGPSVQILNSVVRHFQFGIYDQNNDPGSNLLIEDTIASDNSTGGIVVEPTGNGTVNATLNRITANNNQIGVFNNNPNNRITIANSVMSNNSKYGVQGGNGFTWLAKSVISGNNIGVFVPGTVFSYRDNYIGNNTTPVSGSLASWSTQ
jgi:hypothetical protein